MRLSRLFRKNGVSLFFVLRELSATGRFLVQKSPTGYDMSN